MVKNQRAKQRERRSLGDCWQWETNGQCSRGDNCSVRHDINKRGKVTQSNPYRILSCSIMREMRREPEVPEERVPVVECHGGLARITSEELAPLHSVKMASSRMLVLQVRKWMQVWGQVLSCSSSAKGLKKNGDKSAVAMLKITRQLGCVFQDMEPLKSTTILRKSSNILKPIRCVQFTKAVARHANIRDQNPSLGMICPGEPHQRSPHAPKFEDRSQEEREWQEQGAREAAWKLAKIS